MSCSSEVIKASVAIAFDHLPAALCCQFFALQNPRIIPLNRRNCYCAHRTAQHVCQQSSIPRTHVPSRLPRSEHLNQLPANARNISREISQKSGLVLAKINQTLGDVRGLLRTPRVPVCEAFSARNLLAPRSLGAAGCTIRTRLANISCAISSLPRK